MTLVRGLMSSQSDYSGLIYPNTFETILGSIVDGKSVNCVGHDEGASSGTHLTDTPNSWTASCGVIFTQLTNNFISNSNGADCQ